MTHIKHSFPGTIECSGSIEVICGSMFSGKTEELIKRLNDAKKNGLKIEVFSPEIDTRYASNALVSHNALSIPSTPVNHSSAIFMQGCNAAVVGIDEAQFFDLELPAICTKLADNGIRVIVSGLEMDFKRRPFGPMPALLAIADFVTKLNAVCVKCGGMALYSYRLVAGDDEVLIGEENNYEPRCRRCYHTDS